MKFLLPIISASLILLSCDKDEFENCNLESKTASITSISTNEVEVNTSILINATPKQVWSVLTDFATYNSWSSTFKGLEGDIKNGGQVNALFTLQDGSVFKFPHTLVFNEGVSYGWSDPIITLPGITDNHYYIVESCKDQVNFIQTDGFKGSNPNITIDVLAESAKQNYIIFNEELKKEVEKRYN